MKQKNQISDVKPKIGITVGDIHGIGPEIIIKALSDHRLLKSFVPVIYGSGSLVSFYKKSLNLDQFNFFQSDHIDKINPKKINVINCWNDRVEITPGLGTKESGKYAKLSLQYAVSDLKDGKIDAMVTAPLSKELVKDEDFEFPGHTEYLANALEAKEALMVMMLDDFRVAVVTGHIPLKEVSHKLDKDLLSRKLDLLISSLQNDFDIKKPKIAVLGLNPHAGENGMLGSEDSGIIQPVIDDKKNHGHMVFGPYPADGFFGSGQQKNFDAVLAMYHDQGLIPFKTLTAGEGVNYTAGLSKIRTSPAHGTAFNLAGKNLSDPTSMRNAIYAAIDLARTRYQKTDHDSSHN
jgi:4-hydroxythreonine-4-phosphate dehydrogenase